MDSFADKILESGSSGWYEGELEDHWRFTFEDADTFEYIGFVADEEKHSAEEQNELVTSYIDLAVNLGSHRAWRKLEDALPPAKYIAAACDVPGLSQEALRDTRLDWERILMMEEAALNDVDVRTFLKDIPFIRKAVCRLVYMVFERSAFDAASITGQRLLRGLFLGPADNKLKRMSMDI